MGKDRSLYGLHVPLRYLRPVCALYPVSFFCVRSLDTPGQLCFSVLYSFDHGLFASTISVDSGIIFLIALDAHKHVWSRLIA